MVRWPDWVKVFRHSVHSWDPFLVWTSKCRCRSSPYLKPRPQYQHVSLAWIFRWTTRLPLTAKLLPHISHSNGRCPLNIWFSFLTVTILIIKEQRYNLRELEDSEVSSERVRRTFPHTHHTCELHLLLLWWHRLRNSSWGFFIGCTKLLEQRYIPKLPKYQSRFSQNTDCYSMRLFVEGTIKSYSTINREL